MLPGAELFSHHAFVDLETTGLDPDSDEVIEVGVLFVHQGQPARRISRLFRPSLPLPLDIQRLTGITPADLADSPPFDAFRPELRRALSGWTVVAHNAAFEQGFLFELLREIQAPVLDSCEALHYLYPELESYSLDSTIRWMGVGERAQHRALQDCEDTFAMLCRALSRCVRERREEDLVDLLACLDPQWGSGSLLGGSCERERRPPMVALLWDLFERCRLRETALAEAQSSAPLAGQHRSAIERQRSAEASSAFSAEQLPEAAATHIARALLEGSRLAIEIHPGPNRSLTYLRPAAMFARSARRRVGIAVRSAALREKLLAEDLPELNRALGGGLKYSAIRPQSDYLCRRRALAITVVAPEMSLQERAPRAYLRSLLRRSPRGELDRASYWFRARFPLLEPLLQAARSEPSTTLRERCPHFKRCYYHSAVASAKEADLVIADHSLAASWPAEHPPLDDLVVDEADHLEDELSAALTVSVSLLAVARLRNRLLGFEGIPGLLQMIQRHLEASAHPAALEWLKRVEESAVALENGVQGLGRAVCGFCDWDPLAAGRVERRVTDENRCSDPWRAAQAGLKQVGADLEKLTSLLAAPYPLASEADRRELAGSLSASQQLLEAVRILSGMPAPGGCIFATAKPRDWALSSQPTHLSRQLARLEAGRGALVLTADALSTQWNRPWVLERLGLSGPGATEPITFVPGKLHRSAAHPLVVLVTDAPSPRAEAFLDWAAARISGLASFTSGGVLGIFSSKARLVQVAERVRQNLEPIGIQVVRETSRGIRRARNGRNGAGMVRLGGRGWWLEPQLPQAGIRCAFMDKLPIESSSSPLVAARESDDASAGGRRGFVHYRLPRALVLLRQAIQRLNCWPSEVVVIVLASPGSRSYRDHVLAALDGQRVEVLPWSAARVRIHQELNGARPDRGPLTLPAA